MATKTVCFPTVRGRVSRFTQLDNCGRPEPGDCGTIVTDDVVSVKLTAEVEEGEEISVRNYAGRLVISDKPPSTVKWFTVEIQLIKIMPQLLAMTSNYPGAVDDEGSVIGYDVGSNVDGNFALETWGDIPGEACPPAGSPITGQWSKIVMPWIGGMTYTGEIAFENAAMLPTLSGTTKLGHGWGRGPYNITVDMNGNPVPEFTPIGSDKHLRHSVVYLEPPVPACECQELVVPISVTAVETVPHAADRRQVTITWSNPAGGLVDVAWGDTASTTLLDQPAAGTATLLYLPADDGPVTITVTDANDPTSTASATLTIPFTP